MKARKDRFIGFLLPESVDDCLRLQAIMQEVAKGALIRNILMEHIDNNNWTVDNLIDRYARHLYSQWDLRWRDKYDFNSFIAEAKKNLRTKSKLPEKLIKPIIEQCKEQNRLNQFVNK